MNQIGSKYGLFLHGICGMWRNSISTARALNMKGKRLPPLKPEDVKLVLKPLNKGTFHLKPRVLYLDETGKYKSHEPDPITITVKELGISGWLKGPSR